RPAATGRQTRRSRPEHAARSGLAAEFHGASTADVGADSTQPRERRTYASAGSRSSLAPSRAPEFECGTADFVGRVQAPGAADLVARVQVLGRLSWWPEFRCAAGPTSWAEFRCPGRADLVARVRVRGGPAGGLGSRVSTGSAGGPSSSARLGRARWAEFAYDGSLCDPQHRYRSRWFDQLGRSPPPGSIK